MAMNSDPANYGPIKAIKQLRQQMLAQSLANEAAIRRDRELEPNRWQAQADMYAPEGLDSKYPRLSPEMQAQATQNVDQMIADKLMRGRAVNWGMQQGDPTGLGDRMARLPAQAPEEQWQYTPRTRADGSINNAGSWGSLDAATKANINNARANRESQIVQRSLSPQQTLLDRLLGSGGAPGGQGIANMNPAAAMMLFGPEGFQAMNEAQGMTADQAYKNKLLGLQEKKYETDAQYNRDKLAAEERATQAGIEARQQDNASREKIAGMNKPLSDAEEMQALIDRLVEGGMSVEEATQRVMESKLPKPAPPPQTVKDKLMDLYNFALQNGATPEEAMQYAMTAQIGSDEAATLPRFGSSGNAGFTPEEAQQFDALYANIGKGPNDDSWMPGAVRAWGAVPFGEAMGLTESWPDFFARKAAAAGLDEQKARLWYSKKFGG